MHCLQRRMKVVNLRISIPLVILPVLILLAGCVTPPPPPFELILNTGWDQVVGATIAYGAPDDDWSLVAWVPGSGPYACAYSSTPPGPPTVPSDAVVAHESGIAYSWGAPLSDSRWVSTDANGRYGLRGGEIFTYRYEFTLPAGPPDLLLNMTLRADQQAEIFLNGNSLGSVPNWQNHNNPGPVTITTSDYFLPGSNALEVVVRETTQYCGVVSGFDAVGSIRESNISSPTTVTPRPITTPAVAIPRPNPDLTLTKAQRGDFQSGGTGTYVVSIQNIGNGTATQPIIVQDVLPVGFTFVQGSANQPWSCAIINTDPTTGQQTLECIYPGALAPGESLVLMIDVDVNPIAAIPPGPNCAEVLHPGDVNPDNDESCIRTLLAPPIEEPIEENVTVPPPCGLAGEYCNATSPCCEELACTPIPGTILGTCEPPSPTSTTSDEKPDLASTKTLNRALHYGGSASYTILVGNTGQGTATSPISLVDVLPDGLTFVGYSDPYSTSWSCTASGQQVTCTYTGPDISPGGFLPTLIINVTIAPIAQFPGGSDAVENCAKVNYADDAEQANNEGCVTSVITP